jgi:hypothetical protein
VPGVVAQTGPTAIPGLESGRRLRAHAWGTDGSEVAAGATHTSSPVGDSEAALARLESTRDERPRLTWVVGVVRPLAWVVVRTEAKGKVGAKRHPDRDEVLEMDAGGDSALEPGDHALAHAREVTQPTLADAELTSTKAHACSE